ncbi:hypothetical protein MKX53_12505 [Psychrobacillus sp. FSL K6-4615]|uniref:hypothetical protein n=1 Tax=Psychrobacillus sp. FSL K6-4615 TaxID=2921551 RepID=UPI0030F9EA95
MDDKQLEERLNLLKSSYDRLPSSIDPGEILTKIENENNVPPIEKKIRGSKRQRITVWAVSVASVLGIGLLGTTYLTDSDNTTTSDENYSDEDIEKFKSRYKDERLKRQKILQMNDAEFTTLDFVQYADNIFSSQIAPGTLEGKNDDISIQEAYDLAIEGLNLPSEMIEVAKQRGKINSKESSYFVEDFVTKTENLVFYYEQILRDNEDALKVAKHEGRLSEHVLIANRYNLSKEIQSMIEVLPKEGLKLGVNLEGTEFRIIPDWALFTRDLFSILDENEARYLGMYELIPGHGIATLLEEQELSQLGYYLASIEFTLLNSSESSAIHSRWENYYFELAEKIIFPSDIGEILNDDNKINIETQMAWESLVNIPGVSPLATMMKPIVASMKSSDWTYNENYKLLDIEQLRDYYLLALDNKLETNKLDWISILPDGVENSLETPYTMYGIHELYKKFNENFNPLVLHGTGPMDITLLYHYADGQDNHEMMWELMTSDFKNEYKKAEFLENPTFQNIIGDSAKNLYFNKEYLIPDNNNLKTYIGQEKGSQVSYDILLRLENDDIWRIQGEEDHLTSNATPVDDKFVQRVHALYKLFAGTHDQSVLTVASPEEIVGLYYYSAQLNDYETQYELYIKDEGWAQIPKEEYMNGEHQIIVDIRLNFKTMEFNTHGKGEGVVTLTKHLDTRKFADNKVIGFQLIQTENGWRPPFMPTQ